MDFSQSQYPVITNVSNQRDTVPNSKYLQSNSSGSLPLTSHLRNALNDNHANNNAATPLQTLLHGGATDVQNGESKNPSLLANFKNKFNSFRQGVLDDSDDNSSFDANDLDGWLAPRNVFRYTRDFVSEHPGVFFAFLVICAILIYVIYLQHKEGANVIHVLQKHGFWNSDEEQNNDQENNNQNSDEEEENEEEEEEEEHEEVENKTINMNNFDPSIFQNINNMNQGGVPPYMFPNMNFAPQPFGYNPSFMPQPFSFQPPSQ